LTDTSAIRGTFRKKSDNFYGNLISALSEPIEEGCRRIELWCQKARCDERWLAYEN